MTSKVLTRRPSRTLSEGELTFMPRHAIDADRADAQHEAYRAAIQSTGAELVDLPALEAHADATFVEDMLLTLPEAFVACRSGAVSRQGELASVLAALPGDRPVLRIEAPATLDGGDVLRIGRTIFVGMSSRTNAAAAAALRRLLEPLGYRVQACRVNGALHLKTAVTSPAPGLLLFNPAWADAVQFGDLERIEVHPSEPFAGNSLPAGGVVFMQTAHARTADRLRSRGVDVRPLDIGEFAKAEAGLTCLSVWIPSPAGRSK